MRREQTSPNAFGARMRGRGARWEAVRSLFDVQCRRLGLDPGEGDELRPLLPQPVERQSLLFEEA